MTKSNKNKKKGEKPLTLKAVLRGTGMTVVTILLLLAVVVRIWHYFRHHLNK